MTDDAVNERAMTPEELAAVPDEDPGLRDQDAVDAMEIATEEIPLFVCVTGAPGAGKSELAAAIAAEYGMDVIDGYAQDLKDDMDIALGFDASYVPNLMVAMEREKADHKARRTMDRDVVVVGSLLETFCYAGIRAEYLGQQIQTPQQQGALNRELQSMQVLGIMIQDLLKFQYIFYLKLPAEIIVPGQEPKFNNALRSLDNALTLIVSQIGIPVHELTGTLDQKMESVKETIGALAKS